LGSLGIENQKPKIVNFSLSKPATTTKNKNKNKIFIIIIIFSRVRVDSRLRPQGKGEGREGMQASVRTPMSTGTLGCVRADGFLLRQRMVKPVREVNTDAGGRPDGKDIRTVIFIQKRLL
jgi:hypothetical protein